jgi:hypothetical protein
MGFLISPAEEYLCVEKASLTFCNLFSCMVLDRIWDRFRGHISFKGGIKGNMVVETALHGGLEIMHGSEQILSRSMGKKATEQLTVSSTSRTFQVNNSLRQGAGYTLVLQIIFHVGYI